ncbi:MAG: hypothetical protein AAFY82_02270 [Pseudomonadota bacterium]
MARDIDERKKRKALRKLRKAAALAEQGLGPPLSDWETQFLEEVEARIETYGSAFHDLDKGGSDEALSALQQVKLREIDKKARGKGKSSFKQKGTLARKSTPRVRQIDDDLELDPPESAPRPVQAPPIATPQLVSVRALKQAAAPSISAKASAKARPRLRVIDGGADKD